MRNITISVDEDTYRCSRIRAAELDTSVSALVRDFLRSLVGESADRLRPETEIERRRRLLREVIADFEARGVGLCMADNLSREALYDRDVARTEAAVDEKEHRGSTSK